MHQYANELLTSGTAGLKIRASNKQTGIQHEQIDIN